MQSSRALRSLSTRRASRTCLFAVNTARASSTSSTTQQSRNASSVSQRPNASHVSFPGALKSAFTSQLKYETPEENKALPTYRIVDQNGVVVDSSFQPDISPEEVVALYRNMLFISVMDLILFDAQRQGRISFYMVSAGEEAISVGSASVLDPEDPVFCQYREQGFFKQRGFTAEQFMSQCLANVRDSGRGRNMPVHYGSSEFNIVGCFLAELFVFFNLISQIAHDIFPVSYTASASIRSRVCSQNAETARPLI